MLKYPALVASLIVSLALAASAQVYYPHGQQHLYQIPPGHYYCAQHNEICTHGLSTPEVYHYQNNGRQPVYGNQKHYQKRLKKHRKEIRKQRRANERRYR